MIRSAELSALIANVLRLIRNEAALVKAEMSENMNRAAVALGLVIAGILTAFVALIALAGAGVAGLIAYGLEPWAAALIVTGVIALIAVILLTVGIRGLKARNLTPTRSMASIRDDFAMLRDRFDG